jgi:hypothetical protein
MNKKYFLVLSVALTVFSSCRKDRTCSCSNNGTDLATFSYTNVRRSEARNYCAAQQDQYQVAYPGTSCVLR